MNYQLSVGFNGKKDTLLKIINSSNKVGDVYTGGLSGKIYGGRFQSAYLQPIITQYFISNKSEIRS